MADFLTELEAIIGERKQSPKEGSYTSGLFAEGTPRIAQKVGEEAVEVIVAALSQSRERQVEETADLFFHLLVLLAIQGITLDEVRAELQRRHK
jgi:phosphoribosyl-ATP pyrophosphohydrolase